MAPELAPLLTYAAVALGMLGLTVALVASRRRPWAGRAKAAGEGQGCPPERPCQCSGCPSESSNSLPGASYNLCGHHVLQSLICLWQGWGWTCWGRSGVQTWEKTLGGHLYSLRVPWPRAPRPLIAQWRSLSVGNREACVEMVPAHRAGLHRCRYEGVPVLGVMQTQSPHSSGADREGTQALDADCLEN